MINTKNIATNYKETSYTRNMFLILCPIIFFGLIILYFRAIWHNSKNSSWKADLVFSTLWISIILVFLYFLLQLICYKKVLSKVKIGIPLTSKFIKMCQFFYVLQREASKSFWQNKQTQKLVIISFPIVFLLVVEGIFLPWFITSNSFTSIFVTKPIYSLNQILLLIGFIGLLICFLLLIIKIFSAYYFYNYQGFGSKKIKKWCIIGGLYGTYKKIIVINKKIITKEKVDI